MRGINRIDVNPQRREVISDELSPGDLFESAGITGLALRKVRPGVYKYADVLRYVFDGDFVEYEFLDAGGAVCRNRIGRTRTGLTDCEGADIYSGGIIRHTATGLTFIVTRGGPTGWCGHADGAGVIIKDGKDFECLCH